MPEANEKTATGRVFRREVSSVGGYRSSATTNIHLAVSCESKDGPPTIIAFMGASTFAMLPLAQIGDMVRFTYDDSKNYIRLIGFQIVWEDSAK